MALSALILLYALFFLSGAAALVYQVVWVRALALVFGGSHLAVTVVLTVFMAGLAAGGALFGRTADSTGRPLRLYGLLEIGIAVSALIFLLLMTVYPALYAPIARGKDDAPFFLSFVRVLFSSAALIIPTTFMGGTLPVLARVVSDSPERFRSRISLLYALNTLGAVAGTLGTGFILLRQLGMTGTTLLAVAINGVVGVICFLLRQRGDVTAVENRRSDHGATARDTVHRRSVRPILWGIGISGFCALGYEVLWSRILTIVIGASVYGFIIMLAAFLTGIALGSQAYGFLGRTRTGPGDVSRGLLRFGATQIVIGGTALIVTILIRDLPSHAMAFLTAALGSGLDLFTARSWSHFLLAFSLMVVPSFFMGLSFPLAAHIYAEQTGSPGRAVGTVLAFNTVGAILGAAASGFAMIRFFGIERSLQMLTVVNAGAGAYLIARSLDARRTKRLTAVVAAALLLFLALAPDALRVWDRKYFAIYRNNQPAAFRTPEMVRDALQNTDVLYYAEGVESIVSSIKVKGGEQAFLTNGRVEASTYLQGRQCQYVLGHLPMLLHARPRSVLVVGTGSGMTLGATSAHPGVESITLVELEPKVLGVARTFGKYNHEVLDDPRLRILFNDGRNFLTTTDRRFDIITADPIHPWFRGAGSLYTREYFRLAAARLERGGIMCQWLPLYELTVADLRSVVRTFTGQFRYTMLWLTHFDAELVGSNKPIVIDENVLEKRLAVPAVSRDLAPVMMGSAEDLLGYFVMGSEGMREFGAGGTVNTDDNLFLELSAPFSIARPSVMSENVLALTMHRESILPHLVPRDGKAARAAQLRRWSVNDNAAGLADRALSLFLGGRTDGGEFRGLIAELEAGSPGYAPGRFLRNEYQIAYAARPVPLAAASFLVSDGRGRRTTREITAVRVGVGRERTSVVFVENNTRETFGQLYASGGGQDVRLRQFALDVLESLHAAYLDEERRAVRAGGTVPSEGPFFKAARRIIKLKVREAKAAMKSRS